MDSILTSIKKTLGLAEDYEVFDPDIIMHINSVFATLCQLGVGPEKAFSIQDKTATWSDFLGEETDINSVKSYMGIKVKLLFDSNSLSSAVLDSLQRQANEFEWRLNVAADKS